MNRRIGALLAAMTLALGVAIALPAPSYAAPSCPAEHVCLWDGENFTGERKDIVINTCHWLSLGANFNNRAESAVNNSGSAQWLADTWTCGGDAFLILQGQALPSLGFMNNRVTGVGW